MSDSPFKRFLRKRLSIIEEGFWRAIGTAIFAGIGVLYFQPGNWLGGDPYSFSYSYPEKPTSYDVYDYSSDGKSYDYYDTFTPSYTSSIDYTYTAYGYGDYYPADAVLKHGTQAIGAAR